MNNPCLACGACCAYFRVSFYWSEAEPFLGGQVPVALTVPINHHYIAMKGTDVKPVRCIALEGTISEAVSCSIYAQRSSTCHEVMPSWHNGVADEKCDRARLAHGLPPLTPNHSPELPHTPLPQST